MTEGEIRVGIAGNEPTPLYKAKKAAAAFVDALLEARYPTLQGVQWSDEALKHVEIAALLAEKAFRTK